MADPYRAVLPEMRSTPSTSSAMRGSCRFCRTRSSRTSRLSAIRAVRSRPLPHGSAPWRSCSPSALVVRGIRLRALSGTLQTIVVYPGGGHHGGCHQS